MTRATIGNSLLLVMMLVITPVWAEEPAKEAGDNASETGKNEIPICKKNCTD